METKTEYRLTKDDILSAKTTDMVAYLSGMGMKHKSKGHIIWFSSPFSSDSDPSFAVYPHKNRFMDYSTGQGGDMIDLARMLHGLSFQGAVLEILGKTHLAWEPKKYKKIKKDVKKFNLNNYINHNEEEIEATKKYAESRGITEGYYAGFYSLQEGDGWVKVPAMMFPHRDDSMHITGAKFRNLDNEGTRFMSRGTAGFYILKNVIEDTFTLPILYLVESETSANSLYMYLKGLDHNCIVISYGGVNQVPEKVPFDMPLKIIIDFDGDEQKYNKRINLYKHLNGSPIKLMLPKGEDMNSLWVKNKIHVINKPIFNE